MEQISGLGPFSDLNALSGFSGFKKKYFIADMQFSRLRI